MSKSRKISEPGGTAVTTLQGAIKYYLDFLKIDDPVALSEAVGLREYQAEKILNFVNGLQPSYTEHAAVGIGKDIEAFAALKGCPYNVDFPGKWRLRKADVLDILGLCEIKNAYELGQKINNPEVACRIFYGKRPIQVHPRTLKRLCELTGSLPEELADRIIL